MRKQWEDYPPPVRDEATGCLRWQGPKHPKGYGFFGRAGYAHIEAYRRSGRSIPDGYQIDHVWTSGCRYRDCVEPAHLEAVTCAENNRRQPQNAIRGNRPRCNAGHLYAETDRRDGRGTRRCNACNRLHAARHRSKRAGNGVG